MSAKKLFWDDPYKTAATAHVTSVNAENITLDQTILYAFSGGQESDNGTIGGFPVQKAEKAGPEIRYTLPEHHGLKAGDEVELLLDWSKRYRLMRLHFAAELVLEIVYQNYGHPEKIGANITSDKARIDFVFDRNIDSLLPEIHSAFKKLVDSNLEIISSFSDEENERRTWAIEGFAKVPCGGTHIKRTGEIGEVLLKRKNGGKGKERIEIYLEQ